MKLNKTVKLIASVCEQKQTLAEICKQVPTASFAETRRIVFHLVQEGVLKESSDGYITGELAKHLIEKLGD